jgi:hypothetical protein
VFAFLIAARFAAPIVSLPPYQFAKNTLTVARRRHAFIVINEGFRQFWAPMWHSNNRQALTSVSKALVAAAHLGSSLRNIRRKR